MITVTQDIQEKPPHDPYPKNETRETNSGSITGFSLQYLDSAHLADDSFYSTSTLERPLLSNSSKPRSTCPLGYKGDCLTLTSAVTEFIQNFIGTFLTFAPTLDNVTPFNKDTPFGSLPITFSIGILSLWVAWETADSHRLVNKSNQADYQPPQEDAALSSSPYAKIRQDIKYYGDRIGLAGEYSGVLNAFFHLFFASRLQNWQTFLCSLGIISIGAYMSYAEARACQNAQTRPKANANHTPLDHVCTTDIESGQSHEGENQHSALSTTCNVDWDTIIGLTACGSRTYFITLVSLAMLLDRIFKLTPNTILDVSHTNLINAAIISIPIAISFIKCEQILYTHYQHDDSSASSKQAMSDPRAQPTTVQKAMLVGSALSLSINFCATVVSLLLPTHYLNRGSFIGLNIALIALGFFTTGAYVRTYHNIMCHNNFFALQTAANQNAQQEERENNYIPPTIGLN